MTKNDLVRILGQDLDSKELQQLYIDELVREPGAKGCINVNGNWFIYGGQDERGNISFTGPFFENEIIYACSWLFKKEDLFEEYKTDEFFPKYMHNHFSSIEEIKEKYPEVNK